MSKKTLKIELEFLTGADLIVSISHESVAATISLWGNGDSFAEAFRSLGLEIDHACGFLNLTDHELTTSGRRRRDEIKRVFGEFHEVMKKGAAK